VYTSPEKAMLSSRNELRKGRTIEVWRVYLDCDKGYFIGREVSLLKGYQNHKPLWCFVYSATEVLRRQSRRMAK
jgi:hypothetical protein